jgi:hypothetical protein
MGNHPACRLTIFCLFKRENERRIVRRIVRKSGSSKVGKKNTYLQAVLRLSNLRTISLSDFFFKIVWH